MVRGSYKESWYPHNGSSDEPRFLTQRNIELETPHFDYLNDPEAVPPSKNESTPSAAVDVPFLISPFMILIAITIYRSRKRDFMLQI
jgi:hypothetical protein